MELRGLQPFHPGSQSNLLIHGALHLYQGGVFLEFDRGVRATARLTSGSVLGHQIFHAHHFPLHLWFCDSFHHFSLESAPVRQHHVIGKAQIRVWQLLKERVVRLQLICPRRKKSKIFRAW